MMRNLCIFCAGLLFALGLGISGMTDANKVIGFLNVAGQWDPSLAFVMVGAIAVHLVFQRIMIKRGSPVYGTQFERPPTRQSREVPPPAGGGRRRDGPTDSAGLAIVESGFPVGCARKRG